MNILKNKIALITVSALTLTAAAIGIAYKLKKPSSSHEPKIELEENIIQNRHDKTENSNTCTNVSPTSNQNDSLTSCNTCIINNDVENSSIKLGTINLFPLIPPKLAHKNSGNKFGPNGTPNLRQMTPSNYPYLPMENAALTTDNKNNAATSLSFKAISNNTPSAFS